MNTDKPSLATLQNTISQFLYARTPSETLNRETISLIRSASPLDTEIGLRIYRNGLKYSLLDVLSDTFLVTRHALGEEDFDQLALDVIYNHPPSENPNLNLFGETLPEQLRSASPDYLYDLARLEWAWRASALAPEDEALCFEQLAACNNQPFDQFCFHFRKSAIFLSLDYPVHMLWKCHRDGGDIHSIKLIKNGKTRLMAWRSADAVHLDHIEPELEPMIDGILNRKSLRALSESPELSTSGRLYECIHVLITRGWLANADGK